ncbi:CRISPR-associated protein Cas2 [Candidatus Electrothrix aarhusensis]|uniref:CRISPR-associated endoribonuclease Cas2 n=1 Tax=Candidatus Electrothrix aarhusensis TaxID=1859131 RepID=A0A444IPT7_9BACT|nr:CRISPR-associated protein Cas2 [Candidatus Electrothrix aarhusensis]
MITYDISDDRIRRQVWKILTDHGERVQYSVFECELTPDEKRRLRLRLAGLIASDDSVRWYPLCTWCAKKIVIQGQGDSAVFPDYYLL